MFPANAVAWSGPGHTPYSWHIYLLWRLCIPHEWRLGLELRVSQHTLCHNTPCRWQATLAV